MKEKEKCLIFIPVIHVTIVKSGHGPEFFPVSCRQPHDAAHAVRHACTWGGRWETTLSPLPPQSLPGFDNGIKRNSITPHHDLICFFPFGKPMVRKRWKSLISPLLTKLSWERACHRHARRRTGIRRESYFFLRHEREVNLQFVACNHPQM